MVGNSQDVGVLDLLEDALNVGLLAVRVCAGEVAHVLLDMGQGGDGGLGRMIALEVGLGRSLGGGWVFENNNLSWLLIVSGPELLIILNCLGWYCLIVLYWSRLIWSSLVVLNGS